MDIEWNQLEIGQFSSDSTKALGCAYHATDLDEGQTTGNIWAPKYYIFPVNDLPYGPRLIFF